MNDPSVIPKTASALSSESSNSAVVPRYTKAIPENSLKTASIHSDIPTQPKRSYDNRYPLVTDAKVLKATAGDI